MFKLGLAIVLALTLFVSYVNANVTDAEKEDVSSKFVQLAAEKNQDDSYTQKFSEIEGDIEYEVHVYDGPRGKGYIKRATKIEGKSKFILENHFGPEVDRTFFDKWTEVPNLDVVEEAEVLDEVK